MRIHQTLKRFALEVDAPTMAEYALMLAFTALIAAGTAVVLGDNLRDLFQTTAPAIGNSSPPPQ